MSNRLAWKWGFIIAENVKITVLKTAVVGFVNETQPVK